MNQMFQKFKSRWSVSFFLRAAAYGIPCIALLVVLYLNYLPFGYDKTFTIKVGAPSDTSGEFRIAPYGDGLSDRRMDANGHPYRTLLGSTFVLFKPSAYLRNAQATLTIDAPGLIVIPPNINFDPASVAWDYLLPQDADAAGCTMLDGATQKTLPDTSRFFNNPQQAFSIYAQWTPESGKDGFQQIVGHHNWELLQNKEDVKFQVGSTTIKQTFDDSEFYGRPHTALATYIPATASEPNGYIELFVDGTFSGRVYFQADANLVPEPARDLTLGKSDYSEASFFIGCIHDVRIAQKGVDLFSSDATFAITRDTKEYPITLLAIDRTAILTDIMLYVVQH